MAPPGCRESEFHVKNMGDGGFRSTSSVGANHLLTVVHGVCAAGVIISRLLATTRGGFVLRRIDVRVLIFGDFRLICESRSLRAENFAAAKKFQNFRSESRPKTYANTHAAACRCSPNMLRTCWSRGKAGRRRATWIMAQSHAISG